jgi:hypothetical protein
MGGTRTERVDVCIVGGGIAGLNALFVVSEYLERGRRVALVDRRERVGGMWVDTYDYVRLHQPHRFFTAGDIAWEWDKDPTYLASKPEVLDHLQHCLDVLEQRLEVAEYLGWSYVSHEEVDGLVRTTVERDGESVVIESDKLVKAVGFNVPRNDPLAVSSTRVRSVSPDDCDVRTGAIASSDAPVWVVGGGKTAMDTVHALITARPGREVNLVAGSGTWFVRRDEIYPRRRGFRRGTRANRFGQLMARRYDGTDEPSVYGGEELAGGLAKVTPTARRCMFGIISDEEIETITAGLRLTVMDRLVDVVDRDGAPELVLRGGDRVPIDEGSWIVNCTGYLLNEVAPYEPYSSPSGKVLSINQRSSTLLFTSFAGYFMTHLLMRDKLDQVPLCELDCAGLQEQGADSLPAMLTVLLHNYGALVEALPLPVFLSCGLDADRWFSPPRRLWGAAAFFATHRRDMKHYRKALEAVRRRYGIRSGPLTPGTEVGATS